MISNLQLPNSEEFDVDTTLTLRKIVSVKANGDLR